jgi:hypothetical protein
VTKILFLLAAVLLVCAPASAQIEAVGIFQDEAGTDCALQDREIGICTFHVVHLGAVNRTGVEFQIQMGECSTLVLLGYRFQGAFGLGVLIGGYSVAYGAPQTGDILVGSFDFVCQGLTPECCEVSIVPHAHTGQLVTADANYELHDIAGLISVINPNQSCMCGAVPAEPSTWGKVKALYR